MATLVYISGPISQGDTRTNFQTARSAAVRLLRSGYSFFLPHLSCFFDGELKSHSDDVPYEDWIANDLEIISRCDAVLRLPGPSEGSDREVAYAESLGIPVFHDVDSLVESVPSRVGDRRFLDLIAKMRSLHCKKASDYGSDQDPLHNIMASEEIGIPAWKGAWLRAKDKVRRIDRFCVRGHLVNESLEDSLMDLAAYALICLVCLERGKECQKGHGPTETSNP